MLKSKLIFTLILFLCFKTVFCQNSSIEYANSFIINQVDKKYKINADTTQKLNNPFGNSNNYQAELPYSKKLIKDSTKRIETKFFNKVLPDWCFYEADFKDMQIEGVKKSLVAVNTKQVSHSKITLFNGIDDDNFLDIFKKITVKEDERNLFIEELFKIVSKTRWGRFWYRQAVTDNSNLYKIITGGSMLLEEEYFFYFSSNSLKKIEIRRRDRINDKCGYGADLDSFLTKHYNKEFLEEVEVNNKECLLSNLLIRKLPDVCFYKIKYKKYIMEYGYLKGILAIDFNNGSKSQVYYNPTYNGENKKFWKLFYGIEVKEFEQAEVSKEILDLFKQVFYYSIIQIVNRNKNIASFLVGVTEYDFYFEDNKLKKIMRGWGNNKMVLE